MRRAAPALVVLLVLAAPAEAAFQQAAAATATHSTDHLTAPTGLTATAGCNLLAFKVSLAWTATTTAFATGYDIYRATGAGQPVLLASVTPRTTVTYVDTSVVGLTTYTYTVRTRFASWTKASASASASTPLLCL